MGLFDSLFGGTEASSKLTPHEAFAGILMGASGCDGHIADDEIQSLVTTLIRMKAYQRFTDKQYSQMFSRLQGLLKKRGVDSLIDACAETLPADLRETAFANACDIVLADGTVEPEERAFIDRLQAKLNIPRDNALAIVQVMVIKNKG